MMNICLYCVLLALLPWSYTLFAHFHLESRSLDVSFLPTLVKFLFLAYTRVIQKIKQISQQQMVKTPEKNNESHVLRKSGNSANVFNRTHFDCRSLSHSGQ